jgi:hypothetical protein
MPSLHFGWALLVGMMAYTFDRRALKVIGVTYPCCMAVVIVTTGHHYLLDIAGGGVVVGLAYSLVQVLSRMRLMPVPFAVGSYGAEFGENPAGNARTSSVASPTFRALERIPRHASDTLCEPLPTWRRTVG